LKFVEKQRRRESLDKGKESVRGRKERELDPHSPSENGVGVTIRAWRRFRGMTVTELALQAGFGTNGRGYISKIEHQQIKRLGEEQLAAIAHALGITPLDLQRNHLPETQHSPVLDKATVDDAILGCKALLRVYQRDDDKRLDAARTRLKLAELYLARIPLTETREERGRLLVDALQRLDEALPTFQKEAPGAYQEARHMRSRVEKKSYMNDLDDAIAGCNALFLVHRQEEHPLDWARTHVRLAQLYWDRATQSEPAEERYRWLGKALYSIDLALPLFRGHAPVSYTQIERMRQDVEGAREEMARSSS
jgi:transcriptional regulator with XRE-family HTH domain